jgi:hypothetical protein
MIEGREAEMTDEIVFGGDATDIPPGTYPGKLVSIVTKQSAQFGDFRAWDFELDSGSVVGGGTSMAMSSRSKGGQWAVALLGRLPETGEKIGQALMGRPCLVVVGLNDNGWPKVTAVLPPLGVQDAPGAPIYAAVAPEPTPPVNRAPATSDDLPF